MKFYATPNILPNLRALPSTSDASTAKELEAEQLTGPDEVPPNAHFEIKFRGPEGVTFDISPSPCLNEVPTLAFQQQASAMLKCRGH